MTVPDTPRMVLRRANLLSPDRGVLGLSDLVISEDGNIASVARHRSDYRWAGVPEVLDLRGFTVVPGLIDAHFHLLTTGVQLLTIDLGVARSVEEVLEVLEAGRKGRDTEFLIGGHLDDEHPGTRLPTLAELDAAFPHRPVFLEHRSWHFALCNTKAIERLRLASDARATGILEGEPLAVARQRLMEAQGEDFVERALRTASLEAARRGATTVHAMEGGDLFGDFSLSVLERIRDSLRRTSSCTGVGRMCGMPSRRDSLGWAVTLLLMGRWDPARPRYDHRMLMTGPRVAHCILQSSR